MCDTPASKDSCADESIPASLRTAMAALHQSVGTAARSQHPKGHGTVQACFRVHELPPQYRIGLFSRPRSIAAWIRFSNAKEHDDRTPDVHGMAIKLLISADGEGKEFAQATTHDFVLADHPVFFARDAAHFLHFVTLKGEIERELKESIGRGASRDEQAALARKLQMQLVTEFPVLRDFFKTANSLLAQDYFSQTPFQFGTRVGKYFARPARRSNDLLGDALQRALTGAWPDVEFEFGIELQTDPATMPIDDATRNWNSPEKIVLATITIPPQNFSTVEQRNYGEALSYSPWQASSAHLPLGSINRSRREVYRDSSRTRHEATACPEGEPELSYFHVQTVKRFFDFFEKADYRGMQSTLHPEVEFRDIGFDLRGREVEAMWHMIALTGIQVSLVSLEVDGEIVRAHWTCDYEFRKDATSSSRHVHNVIESEFRFEGGLICVQHDSCDFWKWFQQAIGPVAVAGEVFSELERKLEEYLNRKLPFDLEQKANGLVRQAARTKLDAFLKRHPEYTK
jgi:ketosteroid isomerase-like protein